jgi:hypothetical protein
MWNLATKLAAMYYRSCDVIESLNERIRNGNILTWVVPAHLTAIAFSSDDVYVKGLWVNI